MCVRQAALDSEAWRPKPFAFVILRSFRNLDTTIEMAAFNMPSEIFSYAPESPPVPQFSKQKVQSERTFQSFTSDCSTNLDVLEGFPAFFRNQSSSDEERSEPEDVSGGSPAGLLRGPPGLTPSSPATWQHFGENGKGCIIIAL